MALLASPVSTSSVKNENGGMPSRLDGPPPPPPGAPARPNMFNQQGASAGQGGSSLMDSPQLRAMQGMQFMKNGIALIASSLPGLTSQLVKMMKDLQELQQQSEQSSAQLTESGSSLPAPPV